MRICLVNHEYPPFPGGGIATYAAAAAFELAAAGHEVHVVTNKAMYRSKEFEHSLELWRDGNLIVHRLDLFDEDFVPAADGRFLELDLRNFQASSDLWSSTASNVGAAKVAAFIEGLHASTSLDVVEVPDYFAEGFYMVRRRRAGRVAHLPPVSVIGHASSRQLLGVSRFVNELGGRRQREQMLREDYCIQDADSLQTPSRSMMERYEAQFGDALPRLRAVIPYYLRLDSETGELPRVLEGKDFLCSVGRIEPRKGSDVLLRGFAAIADEFPNLHLAYLGGEAWREGENFDDILRETVPVRHRKRVLRLGDVPRGQVLAAVREARAFVHTARWDNYPNAALEAMGLGVVCIISDCGGHSEMVEDGESGLVYGVGDVDALVGCLRQALSSTDVTARLRTGARRRIAKITDTKRLTGLKVELFEKMAAQNEASKADLGVTREAHFFVNGRVRARLPGSGVVVVDVRDAEEYAVDKTIACLRAETLGAIGWRVHVIASDAESWSIPDGWSSGRYSEAAPWLGLGADEVVVYIRAGAFFDRLRFAELIELARVSKSAAGAFAWLRPAVVGRFPYQQDGGPQTLLENGAQIPAAIAMRRAALCGLEDLVGLETPSMTACALIAVASARLALPLIHTGDLLGHDYAPSVEVGVREQERALGILELLGLAERQALAPWSGGVQIEGATGAWSAQTNTELLDELERHRRFREELFRLTNHKVIRALRKVGLYKLVGKVVPSIRGILGDGKVS